MLKKINSQALIRELFYVFTGAFLIFFAMELFFPGIILAYVNLNFVLILWLMTGIILVLSKRNNDVAD